VTVKKMSDDVDRLVVIHLSGKRMAIDLATVTEVVELPETWPIPLAPEFFKGVMNSHGALIPVLDLASWLDTGSGRSGGKTLLLDRRLADLALWVDDVERVIPSSDAELLRHGEGVFAAVLAIEGDEIPLISAPSLVDMLETHLQGLMRGAFAGTGERD
jgi:chemotaxis signal transduction protein